MGKQQLALMIPIVAIVATNVMIFGIRYLKNQERMAMIAKGLPIKEEDGDNFYGTKENGEPRISRLEKSLRFAFVAIGAGIGLLLATIVDHNFYANASDDDMAKPYYFAFTAIGAGVGLLAAYNKIKKDNAL
jgi:hypothetical protein